jgi:two-component system C4-dicarboxylate transport sensor histidine kinase DctB
MEWPLRLAELGEMAVAISHELNQPLTGIRNYARNAFYMIAQMRELTRRSDSIFACLDLNSAIRESVEFLLPQMKLSEVAVSLTLAEDLPLVWGDRIRLAQVFLNLLSNARQAMDGAAERRLSIASRRAGSSSPSTPPARAGMGWGSRSPAPSSRTTRASSRRRAS